MRFLVDTHVLLWLLGSPERVPDAARSALAERANTLLVSAASAMEVATKVRLGKLPAGRALVDAWAARLAEISAEELPLSCGHALLAGSMVWDHRDPFDRLLVAQALIENVTLVSTDRALNDVPGLRLMRW